MVQFDHIDLSPFANQLKEAFLPYQKTGARVDEYDIFSPPDQKNEPLLKELAYHTYTDFFDVVDSAAYDTLHGFMDSDAHVLVLKNAPKASLMTALKRQNYPDQPQVDKQMFARKAEDTRRLVTVHSAMQVGMIGATGAFDSLNFLVVGRDTNHAIPDSEFLHTDSGGGYKPEIGIFSGAHLSGITRPKTVFTTERRRDKTDLSGLDGVVLDPTTVVMFKNTEVEHSFQHDQQQETATGMRLLSHLLGEFGKKIDVQNMHKDDMMSKENFLRELAAARDVIRGARR